MQIKTNFGCLPTLFNKKFLRRMRFSIFVALAATLQISATSYSQNATVSVHLKNAGIIDVFNEIERQSEYKIFYKTANIDRHRNVTIDKENIAVDALLRTVLEGNRLSYELIDKVIVITPNETAQSSVTGTVVDNAGDPMPGVNIIVKGTTTGVVTDANGKYSIHLSDNNTVLVFSFIGYTTQEVAVDGKTVIDVTLSESSHEIAEVVVTALGIVRNTRTLSYATQNISGSDLNEVRDNSSNILSSLSGKVAGAVVTTAATGPGGAVRVVLRGNRSINGNNGALIVVDGVPYDNSSPNQATSPIQSYGASDGAVNINPDDIASVNILKGPSAAALYGSRAANGAIIITTKQGREGKFTVDYNGGVSIDQPLWLMKFQNTYGRGSGGVSSASLGESWGAQAQTYPDNVKDFFETAWSFNNSIGVYGGTKQMQGFASYTNNSIGGIIPGNDMDRNTVNLRVNTNLLPGLTTDTKITYVNQKINNKPRLGDTGTPMEAYIMPRDMSSDELGQYETVNPVNNQPVRKYWINSSIYDNPYWSTERTSVDEERNRVSVLGSVKYEFFDWLSLMGRVSYDRYDDQIFGSFYDGTVSLGDVKAGGKYYENFVSNYERNFDLLLSGTNNLSDRFDITYNFGASWLKRKYSYVQDLANGLRIPNQFSLAFATTPTFLDVTDRDRRLNSVYGNVQIGFDKAIYLDVTARNDWSSTLPSPYSYFYPSVGLSAILSDLIAMPSWVNFGKIRASYTQVGNDADPYLLNQTYAYSLGAGQGFIMRNNNKAIADLKPEKTKSFEVGLEGRFLDNRLNFDITLYKSNTINQLLYVGLPMASGYSRQYINAGDIENKGFELQISGRPVVTSDFRWYTAVNFGRNVNKIIEIAPGVNRVAITTSTKYASVIVQDGGSYGDLYGYVWDKDPKTGKYIVNDKGLPVVKSDQKLGNFNPSCQLGWNNTFSYKNFNLSFLIDGRIGGEMVSGTAAYLASYGIGDFTEEFRSGGLVLDAVKADGTVNTTPITAEQFWTTVSQSRDAWGQFFTFSTTNFRMRELSLSYDFKLAPGSFLKVAQVSLVGRNLFFLYKGKATLEIPGMGKRTIPIDPEAAMGAGNYQGIECGLPPIVRTYGLNVKLTF